MEEIATALGAVEGNLICSEDEAGHGISTIGDAGEVPPCTGGVAGVNTDAVSVHTAGRFAGHFMLGEASNVAQDELIGGERDGFADFAGIKSFGQGGGGCVGGFFGR